MAKNVTSNVSQRLDNIERRLKILEKSSQTPHRSNVLTTVSDDEVVIPVELVGDVILPYYQHSNDAGFDLRADKDYYIAPGNSVIINTGIKMAIPKGYELQIRPRSGISLKTDLRVANSPGTIDCGYLSEIGVILTNTYRFKNINARVIDLNGNKINNPPKGYPKLTVFVEKGSRVAQAVLSKVYRASFQVVKYIDLYGSNRGGGFGHTGIS